ncbi:MAG: 5-nucleotidase [Firmicutes bacterium]|nr:5-nucleotidase [Bacillota bacterium]
MRRILGGLLGVALVLASIPAVGLAQTSPVTAEVTIIHDSHVHGNFASGKTNIAQKAAIINEIRTRKPDAVFVGNGDDLNTSLLSSEFHGSHVVDAFNQMGMAVDGIGNHEFDQGPDNFLARVKESKFPWVSANLRDRRTQDVFGAEAGVRKFVIQTVSGVKVGFTGLAPADTLEVTSPGPNMQVLPYAEAMREVVPAMRAAGAQVTVLLSHICGAEAETLAAQVNGIDAIVGDHCADVLDQPKVVNNTIISRVGDEFKNVGELTLKVSDGRVSGFTFTRHQLTEKSPADPAISALMTKYQSKLDAGLAQVVGATTTPLDAVKATNRFRETGMGNFISDVAREVVGADVGLTNGGNVRADKVFQPGPLTKKDIVDTLPFTNYIMKIEVSGKALLSALELGVSTMGQGHGRFLQVSGVTFRVDPTLPAGSRLSDVKVGGKPLNPQASYTVGVNDYMANGGDGYTMLKDAKVLVDANSGPLVSTAVISALQKAGTIAPRMEGRILIVNGISLDADKAALKIAGATQSLDVAPVVKDDVFYSPLRAVAELFGGSIVWQQETRSAVVTMPWGASATVTAGRNGYLPGDRMLVAPQVLTDLGIKTTRDGTTIKLAL